MLLICEVSSPICDFNAGTSAQKHGPHSGLTSLPGAREHWFGAGFNTLSYKPFGAGGLGGDSGAGADLVH